MPARFRSSSAAALLVVLAFAATAACSDSPTERVETPAAGTIAGVVVDASSRTPLEGAEVRTNLSQAAVRTDSQGRFRIDAVAPGSYAVTASREGFRAGVLTVAVTAGAISTADLALEAVPAQAPAPSEGAVTGRVLRTDGRLVSSGVPVEIRGAAGGCATGAAVVSAVTDPLGRYLASALVPGSYVACVQAPLDGAPFAGSAAFEVQAGALAEADLTVQPLATPSPGVVTTVPVISLGERFRFTFTIVSDGTGSSTDVIVTDTLPILDDPAGPDGPGDRDGNQALRYVTDRPTFDPDAIRYYVDADDNEGGTETDVCFQAPAAAIPAAFTPARVVARCNGSFQAFATIADARAAAQAASQAGDQIVAVEYFDEDILSRTDPAGPIEAEDAFEITLEAIHSINEFRQPDGSLPDPDEENGVWFTIVTAISAENDFVVKTACVRVVEALLEVRKTVSDASVPAGSQTEFLVELGNTGSDELHDVVVSDTLDVAFLTPGAGDPGLVMVEDLCEGCTLELNVDSTVITVTVPEVPSTDVDDDGVFDDGEGFLVANLVVRTPLRAGTFCNRVTVRDEAQREDTDIACVVTEVEVELDIVNDDGSLDAGGVFEDVETFRVGDSVAYRTAITNRSTVPATDVRVLWELAPEFRILQLERVVAADPASIACSTGSDTCSVEVSELAPGGTIALSYLALAAAPGDDVNRIRLSAAELSLPIVNEEPTTVVP